MASGTLTDLSPPDSWEDWETLVADLARRELGDPLAVKHGGKNEGDVGVDAYARYGGSDQLVGLQAKETQKLGKTEIRKNVERAREFEPGLDHYVFVWSGERSTKVQQRVLDVSEINEEEGSFPVSLWTWDDVREMLARHPDLLDAHFPDHGQRYEELKNRGFYRLSESHFDKQRDKDLEDAWSAGLRPVDIRDGYAIDRWWDASGEDEDDPTWVSMTGELLRRLEDENVMVRGRPGSGKSAVSVTVANQWYEQGKGAVFYRPSGARRRFQADDSLRRAIETAEGHVLVVVEDAVREETKEIHDVVHDLAGDDSVSFLLDGRHGEYQEFDVGVADTTRGRRMSSHDYVSYVDLDSIRTEEVEQMVALYEAETGEEAGVETDHLMQRLDRPGWVGDMLHVTYHLLSGEGVSGLEADAAAKFDALNDPEGEEMARSELQRHDESLLIRSGLLLNLLNLADVSLHRVFVDALPEAMGEDLRQDDLDSLVDDALRGWLVFGDQDDEVLVGRHEFWSFHFLRYVVHGHEDEDEEDADDEGPVRRRKLRRWITHSVNAVVAVLDDPDRRSRFVDDVGATDESDESERTPEDVASDVLGSLFQIGWDRPTLAPLFQHHEDDDYAIREADVCPDWLVAETLARRGDILRKNNDLEGQEREEEITGAFEQAIETLGDASTDREKQAEALVLDRYASFFHDKGEYGAAIERYERALELREEIGDRAGEATTLNNLGLVHKARGEWAKAEEYYEDSLAITREIGDRAGEATTLNNLGAVHEARGAWAAAEEYYEASLAITREIGDRAGEAATLDNVGQIYYRRGELDTAEEYYEASLAIQREIGDRAGEATTLNNLGEVHHARGEWAKAEEYYEASLAITREIGDRAGEATTLNNLGAVHEARGAWAAAEEYYEASLAITREIGDRAGEAATLDNVGQIYHHRGELDTAEEYYEDSLAIKREIGDRAGEATTLNNLGLVHKARGAWAEAEEYYEDSLAITREIGDRAGEATTLNNVGKIYHHRGELDTAEEYYEDSLAIKREIGDRAGEATTLNNLGEIARLRGELDTAEEYYEDSLAITREIGDHEGEAKSLGNLGKVLVAQGELDVAVEKFREALAIQRDIGDRQAEAVSLGNLGDALAKKGDHEPAYDHLNDAAEILFDIGDVRQGLTALSHLVDVCETLGKSDEAREHCERALKTIESADLPGLDNEERYFREQYAKLSRSDTEQTVLELYTFALQRVRSEDPREATELFEAVWNRRDDVDEDADVYPLVVAGGVGLAGHLQMFSEVPDDYSEIDVDSILQEIEPYRDRLPLPAKAVFEHLHDGETETTPEGLRELAQLSASADGEEEAEEPPIGMLNAQVFATLLATLQADD